MLGLVPLVTERDHHAVRRAADGVPGGPLRILAPGATVRQEGRWVVDLPLAEETERGLVDRHDLWAPVRIEGRVGPDAPLTLILTVEPEAPPEADAALAAARARDADLLRLAAVDTPASFAGRLVHGADAFLVRREIPDVPDGRSVIAGYPWFNDWGRDTMIALPGLCLATGRYTEAATILRSFARFERDGLIPNDFPDRSGAGAGLSHRRCLALVRASGRGPPARDRRHHPDRGARADPAIDRGAPPRGHALRDRARSGRRAHHARAPRACSSPGWTPRSMAGS